MTSQYLTLSVSGINQTDEHPKGYAKQKSFNNRRNIMRKITKESSKAFVNFEPYKKDNTEVSFGWTPKRNDETNYTFKEKETACLFLHGNNIAEITRLSDSKETISINLDLCGWHTPTTRERINGVLDALGYDFRIAQRNEEQVLVRNADLDEELHMMETWKPKKHNEQIIKLSDDSFNPDIVQKVFDSKFFRTPRLDADGYLETGIDLNAITDF